jgi:uncharacterized protein
MEQHASHRTNGGRIAAVDALRGFALLGILLVHMVEQYVGGPPPTADFGIVSSWDPIVAGATELMIRGKFFMMFSLLFGLSFFIQMDRAAAREIGFRRRFAWRLTVLLVIGLVHHLFYRGDILSVYAVIGLLLLLFYRASDRTLLLTALLLFLGVPRLLLLAGSSLFGFDPLLVSFEDAASPAYYSTIRNGSLLAVFATNLLDGLQLKFAFQFGLFGRGYQTLALFLLGLYLGRSGWHTVLSGSRPRLRRVLLCGLAVMVVAFGSGNLLMALVGGSSLGLNVSPSAWQMALGLQFYDISNLGMMAMLVAGFLLLFLRPAGERVLTALAPVGKTALTCYVCQTLAGTFLLYGWGTGYLGQIGASTAALLALAIFASQLVISALWLRVFRFGPLEWVWRSLTYWRLQPMRIRRDAPLPVPGTVVTA